MRVSADSALRACDPDTFAFETTEDVEPLKGIIGQERAVEAMSFGLRVTSPGYNIYMSGPTGTGKTTYARSVIGEAADEKPLPDDWMYVHNFQEPDEPLALSLPPGQGREFVQDMETLLEDLESDIPKAFDTEAYDRQRSELLSEYQEKISETMGEAERLAKEHGFALKKGSSGFVAMPLDEEGEPLKPEEFQALDEEKRREMQEKQKQVQPQISEAVHRANDLEREARNKLKELDREVGRFAVSNLFEEMLDKYCDSEKVCDYLKAMKEDVVDNLDVFKDDGDDEEQKLPIPIPRQKTKDETKKYEVNLLVDHSDGDGAPVVFETNPTYYNLFGKMEYRGRFGSMTTDFTMIKPGAFHRANGGYLVLQARDVLTSPGAWDALKRTLRHEEVRIENLGEQVRAVATAGLRPEPIPVDVKVVLIGPPRIQHLLYRHDDDFQKLFKIKADFDTTMERTDDHMQQYAEFVSSLCRREELRHFGRGAVARVVEHSSRLASHQEKLSTRFNEVVEVLYEADAWAGVEGRDRVTREDVNKAIEHKIYRSNLAEEKIQELIDDGEILVDTEGAVPGQVNGLAVYNLGDYSFGKPSRITAQTFMGKDGVVNIEREVELSGRIHDKGVMILSGYLGRTYAQGAPLTLSASLTFEQNYQGVNGDSASSTELYALLSSLSEVPLRQDLAVTGSVNQKGEIQPIGGVNDKVEGFFDVCQARGLTGDQGVLIPQQNVRHLMLRGDVRDAVEAADFHIYAVSHVDEGVGLLTGTPAGEADEEGTYPAETIHGKVQRKLQAWSEELRKQGGSGEE